MIRDLVNIQKEFKFLKRRINYLSTLIGAGEGSVSIPETSYASNAEAVAALGVGKLYKSTTLINGSPIILITV